MKLSSLFSDHAILQQDMPIPIWGWTKPFTKVIIQLGQNKAFTVSGDDGKFLVRMPAMKTGGPYELKVETANGEESIHAKDILIGELWLASGQSNMMWQLQATGENSQNEILETHDPQLRMITVPKTARLGRQSNFEGDWKLCAPENSGEFSAVGYFFAKKLRKELNVPVGIIHSSWGGSIIQAWMSRERLSETPAASSWLARYEADVFASDYWERETEPEEDLPKDPGNQGEVQGWAEDDFKDQNWPEMELPQRWQAAGHNHNGVFWFRKTIDLPETWTEKELLLKIGGADQRDVTYFNGVKVGATGENLTMGHGNFVREYRVPGELVKAGRNTIAIRVFSNIYYGGLVGPDSAMKVFSSDDPQDGISLTGSWRYKVEHDFGFISRTIIPLGPGNHNSPNILFDSMINPLLPCAIRGAIWYQGESNAAQGPVYEDLQRTLIHDWRLAWGQGDFPFHIVQLAKFNAAMPHQADSEWARLREAQSKILSESNTGFAVAIDTGGEGDLHPKNKWDVGERLALWALRDSYHKDIIPSGPLYRKMSIEGNKIRLEFDYVAKGLLAKDGDLRTFHIAGIDRIFHPAQAVIEGDCILVSSPAVPSPLAVRYAWADNPEGCNLYNKNGLPASPFRTDEW